MIGNALINKAAISPTRSSNHFSLRFMLVLFGEKIESRYKKGVVRL